MPHRLASIFFRQPSNLKDFLVCSNRKMKLNKPIKLLAIFVFILFLVSIVLLTDFYGNADTYDYSNVAKFFSGDFNAKIRTSHSYLYGLLHAPIVDLTDSYLVFKFSSLIFLSLIVYSVYVISGKNKKSLWLMVFSPIVWYMAPWISPISLASLLFLWGYYFIKKYDFTSNINYLFYCGALLGLSWAFWDGALFFIHLLGLSFLYNKKLSHFIGFMIFVLIGVLPRLILDQYLFGFAFYGIIRHIMASTAILLYGGIYGETLVSRSMSLVILFFIPWFSYILLKKEVFRESKKDIIFVILALIILFMNSQIRLLLLILPIVTLLLSRNIDQKGFNKQLTIFMIINLIVIVPYVLQMNNSISSIQGQDIGSLIVFERNINQSFSKSVISEDLKNIGEEYPDETFIVGNKNDNYASLANIYWGDRIKEFVSIEDYNLFLSADPIISEKKLCTHNRINERRDFCASIILRSSFSDKTNYSDITYAITDEDKIDLQRFSLVKKYNTLYLFRKSQ